ncbi:MAG: dihydrofolate reductase family protein [Solirubrobacterales bacterium]
MRKVVSHTILTLDGVAVFDAVADDIVELRNTEEVLADFNPKVAEEDAMLLGRVTYQEWSEYWPTSTTEPFASHINGVPKYVVSRSLHDVPWGTFDNATLLEGDLAEAVTELKDNPGTNIGVHGSPTLVEGLLQADVLDEMRLEIYPVVAGTGARLLNEGSQAKRLRLADSKITRNGVAILTYERAR